MTQSMTGFARGSVTTGALTVTVECRSVNNRYLDLQCRMPDNLRVLEGGLREQAGKYFSRGKLELVIRVSDSGSKRSCDLEYRAPRGTPIRSDTGCISIPRSCRT